MLHKAEVALLKHLQSMTSVWDIKIPGYHDERAHPYKIDQSKPYMHPRMIPTADLKPAFGFGNLDRPTGIYQIDLYYPTREKSQKPLNDMIERVQNWFYPTHGRGQTLTFEGVTLTIDKRPRTTPLFEGNAYLQKTIEIFWLSEIYPS